MPQAQHIVHVTVKEAISRSDLGDNVVHGKGTGSFASLGYGLLRLLPIGTHYEISCAVQTPPKNWLGRA
eukprot:1501744-Pyramimonas_sp.AAC.1